MEELLEEHLFLWCDAYVRKGKQRKQAIYDFADEYGIFVEIDITYESLKKSEYRLRKKKEQKTSVSDKSSATSLFIGW